MDTNQILAEIREANLSYLMLAQSLVRVDKPQALYRLGISEDTATLLATLSSSQMLKIASSTSTLLCRFRAGDDLVWNLLTNHAQAKDGDKVSVLHAAIVMASRHQEGTSA